MVIPVNQTTTQAVNKNPSSKTNTERTTRTEDTRETPSKQIIASILEDRIRGIRVSEITINTVFAFRENKLVRAKKETEVIPVSTEDPLF